MIVATSLLFIQCGNPPDNAKPEVESDSSTAYLNNQNTTYIRDREELVTNLKNLKEELDGRIERLNAKIDENGGEDKSLVSMRDELREDRSEVQGTIEGLHNSTQNTWNNMRTEAENLHERVSSKLDRWDDTLQNRSSE